MLVSKSPTVECYHSALFCFHLVFINCSVTFVSRYLFIIWLRSFRYAKSKLLPDSLVTHLIQVFSSKEEILQLSRCITIVRIVLFLSRSSVTFQSCKLLKILILFQIHGFRPRSIRLQQSYMKIVC